MNIPPRPPTYNNTAISPIEFQQLIQEKSENFVARQSAFAAITNFLHRYSSGYFTLVGTPGSGKSAILAKYASENSSVIYYSVQFPSKNRVDQFLATICTQLLNCYSLDEKTTTKNFPYLSLPDNASQGSWFLSFLLQEISELLQPNQRLIIAIDALDAIDRSSQPPGTNLFYLPRYLPEKVYFLLSRRPFASGKTDLLIETPSQIFNLEEYPEQNQEDVRAYIQHWLSLNEVGANLKAWLRTYNLTEEEFSQQLTVQSENNFMYLSQILPAIASGFYPQPFQFEHLPPGLAAYYENHWQHMSGGSLSRVGLGVVHSLVSLTSQTVSGSSEGISAQSIAQIIDEDEYEVEQVLENWLEFLRQQQRGETTLYSLYHSSFRNWLSQRINLS